MSNLKNQVYKCGINKGYSVLHVHERTCQHSQLIRSTTQVGLFLFHYFVQENHGQSHGISTVLTQQHLVLIAISQINHLSFSFGLPLTSALIDKEKKKECWFKK